MLRLQLADVSVLVERKPIKHLHLGVYPPDGRVRIAAPERMTEDAIRLFAIGKLQWIRRQQARLTAQARDAEPEYIDRESHYLWGRRYLLRMVESAGAPRIEVRARTIDLHVRADAARSRRADVMQSWYREQLRGALGPLLSAWQSRLGVKARRVYLQRMKTKWGSCNAARGNIRLNTELARKPPEYLEYILVHELAHLREPTHGPRFVAILDDALPQWHQLRDGLNSLPLSRAASGG